MQAIALSQLDSERRTLAARLEEVQRQLDGSRMEAAALQAEAARLQAALSRAGEEQSALRAQLAAARAQVCCGVCTVSRLRVAVHA